MIYIGFMDIAPWQAQLRKSAAELVVLAVLRGGERYGADILEQANRAGGIVAEGALYPLLSRLEKDGKLSARWNVDDGPHPRKYYQLTDRAAGAPRCGAYLPRRHRPDAPGWPRAATTLRAARARLARPSSIPTALAPARLRAPIYAELACLDHRVAARRASSRLKRAGHGAGDLRGLVRAWLGRDNPVCAARARRATRVGARLCPFRCGWRPYAVALLPLPLVMLSLTWLLGYSPRAGASHGLPSVAFWLTLFPVSIFNGVATAIIGAGPLGEEGGWRGYLPPGLLERMGEVRASALLGLIWALWHLPVMVLFPEWRDGNPLAFYLPAYVLGVIPLAYVLTVVWRLGHGSLVPCI